MADNIQVARYNRAPTGCTVSASATGGTWASGTIYSFLIVAWYTASEEDWDNAGAFNFTDSGAPTYETNVWNHSQGVVGRALDLEWTATERIPDHYSVYYQQAAAYNPLAKGVKIYETSDGVTTSVTLTALATDTSSESVALDAASTTDDSFTVRGHKRISFIPGETYTVTGGANAGNYTVDSTATGSDDDGEYTVIYVTGTVSSTSVTGSVIGYELGEVVWVTSDTLTFTIVTDLVRDPRTCVQMMYDGYFQNISYSTDTKYISVSASVYYTSITDPYQYYRLQKWAYNKTRVRFGHGVTSGTSRFIAYYDGYMQPLSLPEFTGLTSRRTFDITVLVEYEALSA